MKNKFTTITRIIGALIIILGAIGSFAIGIFVYNESDFLMALSVTIVSFVQCFILGYVFLGISEIINLLQQKAKNKLKTQNEEKQKTQRKKTSSLLLVYLIILALISGIICFDGIMDLTHDNTDELISKYSNNYYYDY